MKRIAFWILAPFIATFVATLASVLLSGSSFVSTAVSDFCHRWPKWWKAIFWKAYYPTCGYWAWRPVTKGHGRGYSKWSRCGYRWFWRAPKHPNWEDISGWDVFYG